MFQFKNLIPNISKNWSKVLEHEFNADYMTQLQVFLEQQYANKHEIYPPIEQIFSALNYTDLNKVKVVILGQDPYHGEGQAHGLSFSVPKGEKIPPSLRNIYKEIFKRSKAAFSCDWLINPSPLASMTVKISFKFFAGADIMVF